MSISKSIIHHKKTSVDFWQNHIQQWQACKLTQAAYCREAHISYGSFVQWKGLLKAKTVERDKQKFVAVKVADQNPLISKTPQSIQIKLLSGHSVFLPMTIDMKQLGLLLQELGAAHA